MKALMSNRQWRLVTAAGGWAWVHACRAHFLTALSAVRDVRLGVCGGGEGGRGGASCCGLHLYLSLSRSLSLSLSLSLCVCVCIRYTHFYPQYSAHCIFVLTTTHTNTHKHTHTGIDRHRGLRHSAGLGQRRHSRIVPCLGTNKRTRSIEKRTLSHLASACCYVPCFGTLV